MKNEIIFLIAAATGLFSCGQGSKSAPGEGIAGSAGIGIRQQLDSAQKFIHTSYESSDSLGGRVTIQNSLPKGGLKYSDPEGKTYVYAIFWTRITNESAWPLEFSIDFPADSLELPASGSNYFKLRLPADTMTLDQVSLFDYGLADLESSLAHSIHEAPVLRTTISPKGSRIFYVVTLFHRGVEGVMRAGLGLKGEKLFYTVNGKEIQCGEIAFGSV